MKRDAGYHILRVGIGITFLWIGVLIFREPLFWGGFIKEWAVDLLPVSVEHAMIATAVMDILIGFVLLIDKYVWFASLVGAIHLLIILIVAGIDSILVRDIGLLSATIALVWADLPRKQRETFDKSIQIFKKRKEKTA